ncbi:hypothetical protein Tco_1490187, partial [Tanacetum coccineum]
TDIEEGVPVDSTRAGASTAKTGEATLTGGEKNSSNTGLNIRSHSCLNGGTNGAKGGGFGTSPELGVAGVIS